MQERNHSAAQREVTRILAAIEEGNSKAAGELLPIVYDDLRKLAADRLRREHFELSLTATSLVHEAYLRLVSNEKGQRWDSTGHFFAAAAEAMRRILINRARDRKRLKRGGDRTRYDLSSISVALDSPSDIVLEIDEALQQLAEEDPNAATLVKLKFFAGLKLTDAVASMQLTRRQGDRLWAFARAWLYDYLAKS